MRVVGMQRLEDCFDGSSAYRVHMDEPVRGGWISGLRSWGSLDYFPDFPRPYFRLRAVAGYQLKGVEGETSAQLILPRVRRDEAQAECVRCIETTCG